jgi:zinc transport system permease protein
VLLMGSLVIIPAATAMRLSTNLTSMLATSAVLAAGATAFGFGLGVWLHRDAGPLIVSIAAGLFLVSLLRRR